MRELREIVLATNNAGKLREFQQLLGDAYRLIPQSEFAIAGVDETGETFRDNALIKARHAARVTGLPAIADDSGLEVDALNGLPGVRSARFAGPQADDRANNELLLKRLAGVEQAARTARFRCVVVYVESADDGKPLVVSGTWDGHIGFEPTGVHGFGYDPLFIDDRSGRSSAELSPPEKNARSHRGQAVRGLRVLLDAAAPADRSG